MSSIEPALAFTVSTGFHPLIGNWFETTRAPGFRYFSRFGFIRSSIGSWSAYDVSEHISGYPGIHASPVAIQQTAGGELQVYARSENDDLVSFMRSNTGVWSVFNVSAQLTPKMK